MFTTRKSSKYCGTVEATERVYSEDGSLFNIDYKQCGQCSPGKREYIETKDKEMVTKTLAHTETKHFYRAKMIAEHVCRTSGWRCRGPRPPARPSSSDS